MTGEEYIAEMRRTIERRKRLARRERTWLMAGTGLVVLVIVTLGASLLASSPTTPSAAPVSVQAARQQREADMAETRARLAQFRPQTPSTPAPAQPFRLRPFRER